MQTAEHCCSKYIIKDLQKRRSIAVLHISHRFDFLRMKPMYLIKSLYFDLFFTMRTTSSSSSSTTTTLTTTTSITATSTTTTSSTSTMPTTQTSTRGGNYFSPLSVLFRTNNQLSSFLLIITIFLCFKLTNTSDYATTSNTLTPNHEPSTG